MKLNPLTATDGYKTGHIAQYPEGTELVYSNFTARSAKHANMSNMFDNKTVFFGLQGFIQWYLIDMWNEGFFKQPKELVVAKFQRRMTGYLGYGVVGTKQIEELHDLGYLPIEIKALPEGSRVDIKVPYFTVRNTIPRFYWLTNYLETVMSNELWKPITAATIAYEYRRVMNHFARVTGAPLDFTAWQCHDFSMRGMSGLFDSAATGAGHLLSNFGTDTIPAIDYLEQYYGANVETELVGGSVPATEHSVMCMGGKVDEIETFRRLIKDVYPTGIVSIVSDTWDFWKVITEYANTLKNDIMSRAPNELGQAKVVFRPDSGDPVRILCGYRDSEVVQIKSTGAWVVKETHQEISNAQRKGAVECLWDIFGGTTTDKGFRTLDSHVGLIYGDSITLERQNQILALLYAKGFSSANVVFGVGSYTYQYLTRDTFGMAMKATYGVVNGEPRELFKDPATDDGTKKSAKGLLKVSKEGNHFVLHDQVSEEEEWGGAFNTVFIDGHAMNKRTLQEIRATLNADQA